MTRPRQDDEFTTLPDAPMKCDVCQRDIQNKAGERVYPNFLLEVEHPDESAQGTEFRAICSTDCLRKEADRIDAETQRR